MAIVTFGEFRLDVMNKRLWRGERESDLGSVPIALLCQLVERSLDPTVENTYLTKSELRERVWADVHVSDETIRGCVSTLRRGLGDDPQKPRYIETHIKYGWRFRTKVLPFPRQALAAGISPQPPNGPYDPMWYVERLQSEREIQACIEYPGRPVVIYGPQSSGKSTLTTHVLQAACAKMAADDTRILRISLREFSDEHLGSLDAMLLKLGRLLLDPQEEDAQRAQEVLSKIWIAGLDAKVNLKRLVRSHVLANEKTVYLVLSDIEGLAAWRFQSNFFDMLRAWQDAEGLSALRLILETAIPPRLFPLGGHSPLWTKARRVYLKGLDPDQIAKMAAFYGLSPTQTACMQLGELVGGLAGLVRHALYQAAVRRVTLEVVLKEYRADHRSFGAFAEHLDDLRHWLELQPATATGKSISLKMLREAAQGTPLASEEAWPLVRKGLLAETEARGVFTLRAKLYADWLAERST